MTGRSDSAEQLEFPMTEERDARSPSTDNHAPFAPVTSISGKLPPVIIMNLFYSGLAIARDMAGRGARVIGLSAHPKIYGNFTRFCEVRSAPNSQEDSDELLRFLIGAAPELRGAVIFPTRDLDVLFLDRHRTELQEHYRLAIPSAECLQRFVNKNILARAARQAGLGVPRTLALGSREELPRVTEEVGFPCVVKPVSSHHWRESNNWEQVGGRKAFLVSTPEELEREYARVSLAHPEILVQEWIPGGTDNIVIVGAYVGKNSEPLAYFTARKIVQAPDDFGTGCIVRSEDIPDVLEPTIQLWKALGYRGMAEVEYKRDPRTGKLLLIEMNTRHWDQHALSRASGLNLSWTAYCDSIGMEVAPVKTRTVRSTWIAEDAMLSYILQGIYHRNLKTGMLSSQLSGPRTYGIFSWRDPWPFVRYFFTGMLPTITKQAVAALSRGAR
jgi:D-aspartate ligase